MPVILPDDLNEKAQPAEEEKPRFGPGFSAFTEVGLMPPAPPKIGGLLAPGESPQRGVLLPQQTDPQDPISPDVDETVDLALRRTKLYQSIEENSQRVQLDADKISLGLDSSPDDIAAAESSDPQLIQYDANEDTSEDNGDPWYAAHNIANTIFGDEMGLLGLKWDQEGTEWAFDNFRNQLIEHPYSTTFTLATYLVPITAAWMKGARLAQHATRLAFEAGDVGAVTARGLFGTKGGEAVRRTLAEGSMDSTWEAMKMVGPRVRFDDHARLVRTLANNTDEFGSFITKENAAKLTGMTDEAVAKMISEKDLRRMLVGDMHTSRYAKLAELGKNDELSMFHRMELKAFDTFGNKYWNNKTDLSKKQIEGMDRWMDEQAIGKLLATVPAVTDKSAKIMYKFFAGRADADDLIRELGPEGAQWADSLKREWIGLFEAQVDEGFMTADKFGPGSDLAEFHLPAVKKGTAGFGDTSVHSISLRAKKVEGRPGLARVDAKGEPIREVVETKIFDPAKALGGPTMKTRSEYTTWDAVERDLDKLITDPHSLAVGGFIHDDTMFQVHRAFRNIITAHMKGGDDAAKVGNWVMNASDYDKLSPFAKKRWLNIEELNEVSPNLADRVSRMVRKQLEKDGVSIKGDSRLPAIDREIVESFFGNSDESAQMGSTTFGRLFELLTAVHKTSKTSLNPATHANNLVGNMAFIGMSGVNPFGRTMLNDGKVYAHAFTKLARKANKRTDLELSDLLEKDNLIKVFGDDRYITDNFGTRIDLAEVFSDSRVAQMMEAQSFESIEGFARAKKVLAKMESYEADGFGQATGAAVARAIAGIGEAPGVKPTLQMMSSAYLGEDMVPKMMLLSHYLRKGWSIDAGMKEVGRRMPQYLTVGHMQAQARRHVLPWITFQSEAARIIKNNLQDYPVSMIAWLHAPKIAQSMLFAGGAGPSGPEIETAGLEAGTPGWASKYSTTYLNESSAAPVLGSFGGGLILGSVGAAIGGAKGALAMGLAGTLGGYALGKQAPTTRSVSQGERADLARAWAWDFLPQSALSFATGHPSEWEMLDPLMTIENQQRQKELKMRDVEFSGQDVAQAVANVSPLAVGSIITPLIQVASGEGSFGQEIHSEGLMGQGSYGNKMAMGLLGFLMPPAIQKWGMKLEAPGGELIPMADIHENNGSQMTLPSSVTPALFGLAAAGLTFMGGKKLQAAKGAAKGIKQTLDAAGNLISTPATKAALLRQVAIPAVGAGAFTATAATEINTRRFMQDLGITTDPNTGRKSGDWTMDGFFNTFTGVNKSYAVNPGVEAKHAKRRSIAFRDARVMPQKRFQDAARTGRPSRAKQALEAAWKNFAYEHAGDPITAKSKFMDWVDTQITATSRMPQFRGLSDAEIRRKMLVTRAHLEQDITRYQQQSARDLWTEAGMRRLTRAQNTKIQK